LGTPIKLPDGSITDKIVVAKGQTLVISIQSISHNRTFWGPDAWDFKPERWLSDLPEKAAAISAYRHMLTFADGPKVYVHIRLPSHRLREDGAH
jgi:cytochrome P450